MSYGDVDTIITELSESLGLTKHKKIISKAKELMRRSNSKSPSIGASEFCKPSAFAGNATKMFYNAVKLIQNQLGIPRHRTVAQVLSNIPDIKSGIPELIEQTEHLLELYKKKFAGGDTQLQKQYLDFENVEFTCAALYTMFQQNGMNADSFIDKLLIQCKMVDKNEFDRIVKDIKNYCYDGVPTVQTTKVKTPPKKQPALLKLNLKRPREDDKKDIPIENNNNKSEVEPITKINISNTNNNNNNNNSISISSTNINIIESESLTIQDKKQPNNNIVNIDGSISVQEERAVFKKRKDDNFKEWCTKRI
ncbi:hypothetical protein PPL_01692 [Heterostelium album PN500]|uniref:ORC6 second cyclin-like domain-containing protein n=1 Tax=Heterostelium pallidum (strain ATCC 26659 / Pp 5 / PN500) TaxID=670386 RepID=D3B076_HETP5|nr:hypothetical protein PPL_01692 [Heterostelium album PN500]EFA84700.1 hypothetical protein PPL_01692 [Heterostelium album PN500]|eukprot:XP_020436813.1 hypothetical protein PPL_01692 [Heterostelium album PN500]